MRKPQPRFKRADKEFVAITLASCAGRVCRGVLLLYRGGIHANPLPVRNEEFKDMDVCAECRKQRAKYYLIHPRVWQACVGLCKLRKTPGGEDCSQAGRAS